MLRSLPFIRPLRILPALALLLPALAQAHPGHGGEGSVMSGLMHPLGGADHLLALVTAGAWAVQRSSRRLWLPPLLFLVCMVLGATAGRTWLPVGAMEGGIASSVFVLGVMLALALRLSDLASLGLICLFALLHGMAHGMESGPEGPGIAFVSGFAATSALLLGVGILLARLLSTPRQQIKLRLAGAIVACFGLALLGLVIPGTA